MYIHFLLLDLGVCNFYSIFLYRHLIHKIKIEHNLSKEFLRNEYKLNMVIIISALIIVVLLFVSLVCEERSR